ncbi:unnamed protein product [Cochlearia groenlandica]
MFSPDKDWKRTYLAGEDKRLQKKSEMFSVAPSKKGKSRYFFGSRKGEKPEPSVTREVKHVRPYFDSKSEMVVAALSIKALHTAHDAAALAPLAGRFEQQRITGEEES